MPDESAIFDAAIDICRKSDAIDEHVWNHGVLAVMSAFSDCRAAMLKHSEPFIVTSDHRMMEMPQVEAINAVTAMLQGAEPVTTANKLPAIGWLRADYQDDNRGLRGNAPLFVLGKKDPSTVWGLDYIPLTSNSPVIPDGWVACSERMPGIGTEIFYFCQDDGLRDCGIVSSSNFSGKGDAELYVHAEGYDLRLGVDITHWMPLPAAPQQGGVLFNVFVIVLYR
ncbi:DUF551 domain-containing protein [Enterobacter hormaechei]|nr:DUF551 domain-containing protein [Enterobacter hormaechei]